MDKKRVLIIVQGVRPLHLKDSNLDKVGKLVLRKLTAVKGYGPKKYEQLADFFIDDYDIIEHLKASQEICPF